MTYFDDVELRQQIQMQLNRVEQANKFSAAVFFDNDHAFQDGSMSQQEVAINCKLLLQNAIILWNYLSLSEHVINTPDIDERSQIISAIRRGSVITWTHVNLLFLHSPLIKKVRVVAPIGLTTSALATTRPHFVVTLFFLNPSNRRLQHGFSNHHMYLQAESERHAGNTRPVFGVPRTRRRRRVGDRFTTVHERLRDRHRVTLHGKSAESVVGRARRAS